MKNKVKKYLLITFGISWISWLIVILLIQFGLAKYPDFLSGLIGIIGTLGPTIAAIMMIDGKKSLKNICHFIFNRKEKTYFYLTLFSIILILSFGIIGTYNNEIPLYFVIPLFIYALTFGGGFEELGWRGILQPNLEKKYSFITSALITGIIWGLWHAPLQIIEGYALFDLSFFPFMFGIIMFSIFLAYIYRKTNSVFCCAFFHSLYNTLTTIFITNIGSLVIELLIAIICIVLYYKEKCINCSKK